MANIVGLNDIQNNRRRNKATNLAEATHRGFFSVSLGDHLNPRNETFTEMLLINVCPYTHSKSFSVIFSIILTIIFFIQAFFDGLDLTRIYITFLPINIKGPLTSSLTTDWTAISQNYELWRLFTSLFIHENMSQLLGSIISFLIWTSFFERLITQQKMMPCFFISGVLGNLMSLALTGKGAILTGALIGIFGIYGSVFGYLIYNWANMEEDSDERFLWFFQLFIIVFLSFFMAGFDDSFLMNMSGFICGILVGFFFSRKHPKSTTTIYDYETYEKVIFYLGIVIGLISTQLLSPDKI